MAKVKGEPLIVGMEIGGIHLNKKSGSFPYSIPYGRISDADCKTFLMGKRLELRISSDGTNAKDTNGQEALKFARGEEFYGLEVTVEAFTTTKKLRKGQFSFLLENFGDEDVIGLYAFRSTFCKVCMTPIGDTETKSRGRPKKVADE